MNYLEITKCDISNGKGVGVCLWVSGCDLQCKGCHNQCSWDYNAGKPFDEAAKNELFEALSQPWVQRFTITGGHPFAPQNVETVVELLKEIWLNFPNIQIWAYTGYLYEQMKKEWLECIDVLVDGPYVEEQRDITLDFRGSANQRVIQLKPTTNYSENI